MLLNEMELDMDQIAENLNAFEKFLDTLPEKALGLGVRVLFAAVLFLVGSKLIKVTPAGECGNRDHTVSRRTDQGVPVWIAGAHDRREFRL